MEVKVCKNCRRLFNYIFGSEICQDCTYSLSNRKNDEANEDVNINININEEENKFEKVKEYIINYPKATIMQISEANNVQPGKLFEWVRAERLSFSDDSKHAWFECSKCGSKIKSGIVCDRCKRK